MVSSNGTAWSVLASFDTGTQIYDIAYGNEILTIAAILPDPSDPWAIRKFRIQKRSLNDGADWEAIVSSVLPQVDPNIFFDSTLSMFFTNVIATTSIHKSADAKTWIECYKAPDADNIYDIGTRYGGEGFASK